MPRDETDETTKEEEPARRARTTRRYPLEDAEPADEGEIRDRGRPRFGRAPAEEELEPAVTPGSFSRTLGHIALAILAVAVLYTAWQHTRRENSNDEREPRAEADEENRVPEAESEVTTTLAEPGDPASPVCPPARGSSRPQRSFTGPPQRWCIDRSETYVATVETTRGDFEITLDAQTAPEAVNNFVFLARWRFYEGAGFHRVEPGFVMDTGDPVGRPDPGYGGPGYTLDLAPPTGEAPPFEVMAVTTVRTPEGATNGSQFSILTGEVAVQTANEVAPELRPIAFGRVTSGQDVIREIDATGDQLTGLPMEETVIERVTIDER